MAWRTRWNEQDKDKSGKVHKFNGHVKATSVHTVDNSRSIDFLAIKTWLNALTQSIRATTCDWDTLNVYQGVA